MSRRYLVAGLAMLALAAILAIPALAQPRRGGWGCGGVGPSTPATGPLTIDAAADRARQVLAAYGNPDLLVKEVMEFSNHFYVLVVERSTGRGAMELIVERTGVVRPEPGPNMMWNLKYGHLGGGMMGGWGMMGGGWGMMGSGWWGGRAPWGWAPPQAGEPLTVERAREIAAQFLRSALPGAVPDEEGVAFYGYFTFDVERAGRPVGMLSVNAYTGQVWYHAWHGVFVREKEF